MLEITRNVYMLFKTSFKCVKTNLISCCSYHSFRLTGSTLVLVMTLLVKSSGSQDVKKKKFLYCIYDRNDQILGHSIGKEIYNIAWI